jgi:hypothetical protein
MSQKAAPFSAWVLGATLMVGGLLFLVFSTGILTYTGPAEPIIAGAVGLLALPFLGRWLADRDQWWALLASYTFVMLALPVLLMWLAPALIRLPLIVTLVGVAVPFGVAYSMEHHRWWAALAGYTAVALAGFVALTALTSSQELYGAYGLIAAVIPLWALYAGDRTRTWALVPAAVITVLAVLLLLVTGVVAVAQQGFFYTVVHGGLAVLMFIVFVVMRRFDWAAWLAAGFSVAAVLSISFPPAAGFAALALTVGCYIIAKQIDAARSQAAQKQSTPTQQPPAAPAPSPAQASQAQQPPAAPAQPPAQAPQGQTQPSNTSGAQLDKQKTAAHREIQQAAERANEKSAEGTPLAGFRPLNPLEGRSQDDEDDPSTT